MKLMLNMVHITQKMQNTRNSVRRTRTRKRITTCNDYDMSDIHFKKHRVFRETEDVIFYDISVEESNASDLVVHTGAAISPPDDCVGAKSFYIHGFQDDYNRVVSGERTFELVNTTWRYPYHIVRLDVHSGALIIPRGTFHRSQSGENGSIVINQAKRYEGFDPSAEFYPVSSAENKELYNILRNEKPVIHRLGE